MQGLWEPGFCPAPAPSFPRAGSSELPTGTTVSFPDSSGIPAWFPVRKSLCGGAEIILATMLGVCSGGPWREQLGLFPHLVPFVGCQGLGGGSLPWTPQHRLSLRHSLASCLDREGFAFVQLRALQPSGCQQSSLWPVRAGVSGSGGWEVVSSCSSYTLGRAERGALRTSILSPISHFIHPFRGPGRAGRAGAPTRGLFLLFSLPWPCLSNGAASALAYVGTREDSEH